MHNVRFHPYQPPAAAGASSDATAAGNTFRAAMQRPVTRSQLQLLHPTRVPGKTSRAFAIPGVPSELNDVIAYKTHRMEVQDACEAIKTNLLPESVEDEYMYKDHRFIVAGPRSLKDDYD